MQVDHLYISGKPILPGFYVSPTGSPTGNGSWINPWDLQTALANPGGVVHPGDTIWLRGGTYDIGGIGVTPTLTPTVSGTASAPIIFRSYPNETPVVHARFRLSNCAYTWWWGIVQANTDFSATNIDLMGWNVL